MPRKPTPDPDPIVERLKKPDDVPDNEDVISLVGFVGPGRDGTIRVHPNRNLQQWLEFPAVVDSEPVEPNDQLSKSVVWVDRRFMMEELFANPDDRDQPDGRLQEVQTVLDGAPFSVWNLIPETRLTAARMMGLIPYEDED